MRSAPTQLGITESQAELLLASFVAGNEICRAECLCLLHSARCPGLCALLLQSLLELTFPISEKLLTNSVRQGGREWVVLELGTSGGKSPLAGISIMLLEEGVGDSVL